MVSSIIKSSSIKFIYEEQENNYWRFYIDKDHCVDKHGRSRGETKRYLELKVPIAEVGIVTQRYEIDNEMLIELVEWLRHIEQER